jgi:hypothetical protein
VLGFPVIWVQHDAGPGDRLCIFRVLDPGVYRGIFLGAGQNETRVYGDPVAARE